MRSSGPLASSGEGTGSTKPALREATRYPELRDLVRRLNGFLGCTLVSALAGSSEPRQAREWADYDSPGPNPDATERLRTAYESWQRVAEVEGEAVARAWFVSANPWIADESPVHAIRHGRLEAVSAAAQAVVDEAFSG